MEETIKLAENRWALDRGQPVDPAALAVFGGVSEGRMRNIMSGPDRTFTSAGGKIPAGEALKWLTDRESFWNSVWRDPKLVPSAPHSQIQVPVFVPVARDGTLFHPGLKRNGTYTVGEKSDERHVADFDVALLALQMMPAPYWRRPNEAGAWGIVGGIRWERMDRQELERTSSGR